jgi:predicted NBD/HSP70 family sugar kinase
MPQIPPRFSARARIACYILHHREASRQELAQQLRLSMPTVLQATRDLLDSGILTESGVYQSSGGRKARALSLCPQAGCAVGIDVTANHVSYLLLGLDGAPVDSARVRRGFENTPAYWDALLQELDRFLQRFPERRDSLLGVGISLPGIVDQDRALLLRSHLLQLEDFSLQFLTRRFSCPVRFFNDANSAAYAELVGSDRRAVYLLLSNSVGGAIYSPPEIVVGDRFKSAEFGHMIIEKNGRHCYCGKCGCLDAYCSALQLTDGFSERLEDFFARLAEGEQQHRLRWERYLDDLAVGVSNLRMTFDCDIVLGGYVGAYLPPYLDALGRALERYNLFDHDSSYLKPCRYPQEAAAVGAALHFVEQHLATLS